MKTGEFFSAETGCKTTLYKISTAAVFNLLIIIAITAFIIPKPVNAEMNILTDKQTQQVAVGTNIGLITKKYQKAGTQTSSPDHKILLGNINLTYAKKESGRQLDIISDNDLFPAQERVIPLGSVAKDIKTTPADIYNLFSIELILQNITNRVDSTHVIQAWEEDRIDFTTIYPLP